MVTNRLFRWQPDTMPVHAQNTASSRFEQFRPMLLGLAYRQLGSLADAEDVVQDAWLRWRRSQASVDPVLVASPRAYLCQTVMNLCLDLQRSARFRREHYVGSWLPEPLLDAHELRADTDAELAADLSVALMQVLDQLSPLERAAFLLHDVFDLGFIEISEALARTQDACRQLASRGRRKLRSEYLPDASPGAEHQRLFQAFREAAALGDLQGLTRLLSEDAVLVSDGGGKVHAGRRPVLGSARIAEFFAALARSYLTPADLKVTALNLNGRPGFGLWSQQQLIQIMHLELRDGRIHRLYAQRNPDKLQHLQSRAAVAPALL